MIMEDSANIAELEEKIVTYIVKNSDGTNSCGMCGKNFGRKSSHIKNHVETHIEGLSFPCQKCDKTFRSRHSLQTHRSKFH